MSDLDDAKAGWRDKRLDRIEALLDSSAAKADRNADLIAENERRHADLIAENERNHAISRAKTEALIAENKKIIAESKKTTAKMLEEMKWIPLKSGLWSAGMIWTLIFLVAAFPKESSAILRFLSGG